MLVSDLIAGDSLLLCRPLMHDPVILRSLDDQEANETALKPGHGVIQNRELPGSGDFEIDHCSPAWRNCDSLHPRQRRRAKAGPLIDMVEDFSNYVK